MMGLKPASVRSSIRASNNTLLIMNISETGRPIAIIFYMKHRWGRGKTAFGFGTDKIRTQDPGDNKTYLPSPNMTISDAKLIIGTTYIQKRIFGLKT